MGFLDRVMRKHASLSTVIAAATLCLCLASPAAATSRLSRDEFARRLVVDADTVRQLATFEMVSGRPMSDNDIIVPWTEQNADRLIPTFLYDLADRLFANDRDGALDWYAIALVRARYDADRCTDPIVEPLGALSAGGDLAEYLREHPEALAEAIARVLNRPNLTIDGISPLWICLQGVGGIRKLPPGHRADPGTAVKQAAEWPAIRAVVWEHAATMAAGKPQLPGPPRMGRVIKRIGHRPELGSIAWSPDGKLLAMEGPTWLVISDAETGRLLHRIPTELASLHGLSFTADGRYLLTTRLHDRAVARPGSAELWDVRTGERVRDIGDGPYATNALALSADGQTLAVIEDRPVRSLDRNFLVNERSFGLYETRDWSRVRSVRAAEAGTVDTLAFSPDGQRLAADANGILVYDVVAGNLIWKTDFIGGNTLFHSLAYSPDGRYIASSGYAGSKAPNGKNLAEVRIWNAADGTIARRLDEKLYDIDALSWSPSGKYLAAGSADSTVHIWDVNADEVKATVALARAVSWVAFSPDGKRLAAADEVVAAIIEIEP
jgi:sugar lactone lactonase YvrE